MTPQSHRQGLPAAFAFFALFTLVVLGIPGAGAAPRLPASDAEVLERLPVKANDPVGRELRSLRQSLAANPRDAAAAERLARR